MTGEREEVEKRNPDFEFFFFLPVVLFSRRRGFGNAFFESVPLQSTIFRPHFVQLGIEKVTSKSQSAGKKRNDSDAKVV